MEHKHPDKYLICGKSCGDDKIKRLQATIEKIIYNAAEDAQVAKEDIADLQSTITELEATLGLLLHVTKDDKNTVESQQATIEELTQGIRDHVVWAEKVIDCGDLKELIEWEDES